MLLWRFQGLRGRWPVGNPSNFLSRVLSGLCICSTVLWFKAIVRLPIPGCSVQPLQSSDISAWMCRRLKKKKRPWAFFVVKNLAELQFNSIHLFSVTHTDVHNPCTCTAPHPHLLSCNSTTGLNVLLFSPMGQDGTVQDGKAVTHTAVSHWALIFKLCTLSAPVHK